MNSYQKEQAQAHAMVHRHLAGLCDETKKALVSQISDYLSFRDRVDAFLSEHFSHVCTQNCFQSRVSACCSRDGIITFFADVVINALIAADDEINTLMAAIQRPDNEFKCIFLGSRGCMWRVKPIVCEMFLCKSSKQDVFGRKPGTKEIWNTLEQHRKRFTWPDRPVLFDDLERYFLDAGYSFPLMYLHNSPGLLRVKNQAKEGKKR